MTITNNRMDERTELLRQKAQERHEVRRRTMQRTLSRHAARSFKAAQRVAE